MAVGGDWWQWAESVVVVDEDCCDSGRSLLWQVKLDPLTYKVVCGHCNGIISYVA